MLYELSVVWLYSCLDSAFRRGYQVLQVFLRLIHFCIVKIKEWMMPYTY